MAAPTLTYTLSNGSTADADEVMQNFNDLLNGYTDGTKDLSFSALTVAGTATLNGAVTLGNATGDDITFTGSLASSVPIKTTNSYNIGSATLGLASVYFGNAGGSTTIRVLSAASVTSSFVATIPDSGTASFVMTAGTQTVAGTKTFSAATTFSSGIIFSSDTLSTYSTFSDTSTSPTGAGTSPTGPAVKAEKIGNVVTVTVEITTGTGSPGSTISWSGILTAAYRPNENMVTLRDFDATPRFGFIRVQTDGTVDLFHRDGSLAAVNFSTTTKYVGTISYVVY